MFKKVTERSRDSGRRSCDRRPTVKQRFLDVSSNLKFFWKKSLNGHATVVGGHATVGRLSNNVLRRFKQLGNFLTKSLNGHATVVGGHATVGRLSNNVFCTFQAIWIFFEKSHWTVTRQWSEVTRPSADCQTTFLDVSSNWEIFWQSHWTVTRQWSEVTRPSADCQTTFFVRFKQFEFFLKKVTERSRDSGRRSRDRRPTVKQRFLYVSSNLKFVWKKSLNGHATVVGGHATVGRLSNNVFCTFQAIWIFFVKSHWTVTRQWSEVTRPSADCQTTFFVRFKQFEIFLKKVTERSRDSGRRSRDRRPTVKQRFLDVSSNLKFFWKKSPWNVQKTLFDSRPTVAWPPTTVAWPFSDFLQKKFKLLETYKKRCLTVGRRSRDLRPLSRDRSVTFFKQISNCLKRTKNVVWQSADGRVTSDHCRVTVQWLFSKKIQIAWNVQKTLFDSRPTVAWPPTTVSWPFSDFFQKNFKLLETYKKRCLTVGRRSRDLRPLSRDRSVTFFKQISNCLKRTKNVVWQSADGRVTSDHCRVTVQWLFSKKFQIAWNVQKTLFDNRPTVAWPPTMSRDRSVTFFKKISNCERSRDSGRRSRDRRLTVKHIYSWIREREREGERETISVTHHAGTAMLCRWPFHQPASRLRLALTRVVDRQGQLVYEYCKSSHWQVEFMLCPICRSTFTRPFSRVSTPGPSSLDFSRESPALDMWCYVAYVYNGELVSLIGNQWVGIFPPKSKILSVLSLALKWCWNFQDGTTPVGGDTWTSCSAERKKNRNKNKEISPSGLVFPVKYLRNGKRYSSSVFTFRNRKSCSTRRYKRRLCSCYRFRDIKSSTSGFPNADLYDVVKTTPVRMYSHG